MRSVCCVICGVVAVLSLGSAASQSTDRNCDDFATHAEAQAYFKSTGGSPSINVDFLDGDRDGIACEVLIRRGRVERVVDGITAGGPWVMIGGLGIVITGTVVGIAVVSRRRGAISPKSNRARLTDPVAANVSAVHLPQLEPVEPTGMVVLTLTTLDGGAVPATCLARIGKSASELESSREEVRFPGHVLTTTLPIGEHWIEIQNTHPYSEQSLVVYVAMDDISRVEVTLRPMGAREVST